jgi:predicted membrane-bound spermidine synthase
MKSLNDEYYGVTGVDKIFTERQEKGIASITPFVFNAKDNFIYNFRNAREDRMFIIRSGKYVRLTVKGEIMMSDTGMERISNKQFIEKATGRVLIAGLGIGLIINNIIQNDAITEIIVIEKYQDVIDLVATKFNDARLKIVCADIFDWIPEKGEKFNTIYFDIWPTICTDNLNEIYLLHSRFKRFKAKSGWMNSWLKEYLQKQKRKGY